MTLDRRDLARRAAGVALVVLAAGSACTGATEPGDVGEVTGQWAAAVDQYLSIELTLAGSASGAVTGTGVKRAILPSSTTVTPLTVEGVIRSNRVELEIVDSELTAFIGLRFLLYRFAGTVGSTDMRGTLELVEPPNPGNPFSLPPAPGPTVPLTFRRR